MEQIQQLFICILKPQKNYKQVTQFVVIISQTLNTNTLSGYTTEHEYLLIGAIPNQTNTIIVTLTNKQGKVVDTLSWSYNAPSLQGGDQYLTVECDDSNTSSLSNGLYTVLGNDVTEDSEEQAYMRLYDNYGIIRSEIPIVSYRSHRILFENNTMYFLVFLVQK